MKAVIVDAGYGRRLYPITKCISKGLVPVYDRPALLHQLSLLAQMGIREAAVVVSPAHFDTYQHFLNRIDTQGVTVSLYLQKSGAGVVAAYESCAEFTKGSDILLIMGDCLYFFEDEEKLLRQAEACLAADRAGVVIGRSKSDSPDGFMERIPDPQALCENADPESIKTMCAVGMYFLPGSLSGSLTGFVPIELTDSDMDSVCAKLLRTGRLRLLPLAPGDEWFDIGTPERLFLASAYVREIQKASAGQSFTGSPAFFQG